MTYQVCAGPGRSIVCAEQGHQWVCVGVRSPLEKAGMLEVVVLQMRASGYPSDDCFAVRLALEEAVVNAIKHGHRCDPSRLVLVRYCITETFVIAQVEDEGPGFDPRTSLSATARGMHLLHHYMTTVRFNDTGNCVTLCKHRSAE